MQVYGLVLVAIDGSVEICKILARGFLDFEI